MENVTHSLIGVVLGEGIYRASRARGRLREIDAARSKRVRSTFLWAAVLGSNLPDFDFLMRPFMEGGLGYLLHHRGYTHTLALSLPLAAIAAAVGRFAGRARGLKRSASEWTEPQDGVPVVSAPWPLLFLAGWLGVLCHVGADFWNDYGVHPFWPFSNDWLHGDLIFILEPLFWLCLLPFVYRDARSKISKVVCAVLGLGVLAASWSGQFMNWQVALWLTFWGAGWVAVYFLSRARSVLWAFGSILSVLVMFAAGAQTARTKAAHAIPAGEVIVRVSSSPAPGNPLCWRVLVSSKVPSAGELFVERVGVFALGPESWAPTDPKLCQPRVPWESDILVKLGPESRPWIAEFRGDLNQFRGLQAHHCRMRALMRFVRMPYWKLLPEDRVMVGDLRYHWGKGLGFTDIVSLPDEPCFSPEPPWNSPSGL